MKRMLVLLLLLLVPALAFGQAQTTGRVTGSVTDTDGQVIVGAIVTVQSPVLMGERQQRSNDKGEFLFALLPVGPYRVSISAPGKKSVDFTFALKLGTTVPLNVAMETGQDIVEEVTVYGTATRFETTANGENFNLDTTVEELPIHDRRIENIAFNAPNVAAGPNSAPRISGAPAFDTVVLLDGAEISDPNFGGGPTLYIEDAIEEVQVLTSGVSARYGRFQGGVLNAITKTGGNELTASLRVEYENDKWNSLTPWEEDQGTKKVDDLSYTGLATIGGFVLKDRLWFFLAGWYQPDTQSARTTNNGGQYTRSDTEERWQYKLRGAIAPEHQIEASFLDYESEVMNYAGLPAGDLDAVGHRTDPRQVFAGSYQGVLTPSTFLDVQYSKKEVSINSGGDPDRGIPYIDLPNFAVYHNAWWDFTDPSIRNNETYGAVLTHTFTTQSWGSHTIEGGVQTLQSETGGENRQSSATYNILDLTGTIYAGQATDGSSLYTMTADNFLYRQWEALTLGGSAFVNYDAAFIQDTWELGKWRFDLGLRFEAYDSEGPLPTQTVDFNDVAPRLGVTYNLNSDWQLQATWGKYTARLHDGQINNSTGVDSAPRIERFGYIGPDMIAVSGDVLDEAIRNPDNWAVVSDYISPEFPTTVLDPKLSSPYAQDFNLSVKRSLPNNSGTVSLTFTNRVFRDLLDDYFGGDFQNEVAVEFDGEVFGVFDQTVWTNSPEAERRYNGIALTVDYRPSVVWNVGGNYTWSETTGNYEGEATNQPGIGSAIGDYPNSLPPNATPFGHLAGDVTHRIRAWGNYRFDFGRKGNLNLGGLLHYASGAPYNLADNVQVYIDDPDALHDDSHTFLYFFDGTRGAQRFPSNWALDFSSRYQIQVWKDLQAWAKISLLNVLDRDNLNTFNTTVHADLNDEGVPIGYTPGANFGNADNRLDHEVPRTWLVTLGATWK